jgi:hypothetical protein
MEPETDKAEIPMSRATTVWPALGTRFKEIPNWFLINEGVEVSEGCHDKVAEKKPLRMWSPKFVKATFIDS